MRTQPRFKKGDSVKLQSDNQFLNTKTCLVFEDPIWEQTPKSDVHKEQWCYRVIVPFGDTIDLNKCIEWRFMAEEQLIPI